MGTLRNAVTLLAKLIQEDGINGIPLGLVDELGVRLPGGGITALAAALTASGQNQVFQGAGAPTSGPTGTFAGFAGAGAQYVDNATGTTYINTNTPASPTWTPVSAIPSVNAATPAAGGTVTLTVLNALQYNKVTVHSGAGATSIAFPSAASSAGCKWRIKVIPSVAGTYSLVGVNKFTGGTPAYSTGAVTPYDYFEVVSDGSVLDGVVASIGLS